MHKYILLSALFLAGCGPNERTTNDHSGHGQPSPASHGSPSSNHSEMSHADHSEMKSSEGAASAPIELQFLDSMIAHHKGAVEMASLAETRAQHDELKDLAADIISDQEREIAKMSMWRDEWFEGKPPAINMEFQGMSHGMRGMDTKKLATLSGNDFDVEFLKQMIPHHEGAVQMATSIQGVVDRRELRELAEDIISMQRTEVLLMRSWYSEWRK